MTPLYLESAILLNSKKWQHLRESLTEINIAASPSQNAASSAAAFGLSYERAPNRLRILLLGAQ